MTDPVEQQYSRWVYPAPVTNLEELWQSCDPSLHQLHYAYWPDRDYWPGMRILVAGCGSNQAANIAYRNPTAHVLGIDVSEPSLAHERVLKEKYRLDNLSLERCPIAALDGLGGVFDFIVASGVLHHLQDPVDGLARLGRLLTPHGVIWAMVYGRYFRTGVYMMQELFRRLGLGQTEEDVALVRQTLANLQADHLVRNYMRSVEDIRHDAGIVDTFLHTTDRAYTVDECLALVEQAGLRFQGWHENSYYYPNSQVPGDQPLFARLEALPERALWATMELHHGGEGRHEFFCCRTDRPEASWRLDLAGERFFDLVPVSRITRAVSADPARGRVATIARPPFPEVTLSDAQLGLFRGVDNQRSIAGCIEQSGITAESDTQLRDFTRQFFTSLWRLGYATLRFGG